MIKKLSLVIFALLAGIICFNPTYTFLSIFLGVHLPGTVKYIVYPALIAALVLAFIYKIRTSGLPNPKLIPRFIWAAFFLLAWAVLSMTFSDVGIKQSARGFSLDFAGLLVFLSIWLWGPKEKCSHYLRWVIFYTLAFLLVFAVPELINNHAFRLWSGHPLDSHFVVGTVPQLRSLTTGPNPLGTLMTLMAAITVIQIRNKWWRYAVLAVTGLTSGLTYARSAWLGSAAMGIGVFLRGLKTKRLIFWPILLAIFMAIGLTLGAVLYRTAVSDIFFHGKSTEQHGEAAAQAIQSSSTHSTPTIIGYGIGTSGPAVLDTPFANDKKYPKITESWYLQLIQEIGLIGLALFCWMYVEITWALFKSHKDVVGWLAVGLGLNAMFLHVWSTDVNVNVMFWTLAALSLFTKPVQEVS